MGCYDADKNILAVYDITSGNEHGISPAAIEVIKDGTAYVRISATKASFGEISTIENNQICITVNDKNLTYEPYQVSVVGGLNEYIILQSENGTQYRISVNDNGTIVGEPLSTPDNTENLLKSAHSEEWIFELEDGSTETKKVLLI
jgi:hypothetical protein